MTNIEKVEASPATRAETGIVHYVIGDSSWKAFGAKDTEIASCVIANEASDKTVLRFDAHKHRIEMTYSIEHDNEGTVIDTVVNGTPAQVRFAKDGSLVGDGLTKIVGPAINEMFRSIGSDLQAIKRKPRRPHVVVEALSNYCGGLLDAAAGAKKAGESLAFTLLIWRMELAGC